MKLIKFIMIVSASTLVLAGCGKADMHNSENPVESEKPTVQTGIETDTEETADPEEGTDSAKYSNLYDTVYADNKAVQIQEWIDEIVESSVTLQEEVDAVENLSKEYTNLAQEYNAQLDMNLISFCSWMVWDTELNSLWSRMSNSMNEEEKTAVLYDLRVWNAGKEDYIVKSIGESEEGGSIYPLLYNSMMEDMTRKKVHMLAEIYAEYLGESYAKPEFSYAGMYVNCEGTMDIYDSLTIFSSWEGDLKAEIGLYRITTLTGSVTEFGDTLYYADDTFDLTGIITYGWDGAVFTIETSDFEYLQPGDTFTFDMMF